MKASASHGSSAAIWERTIQPRAPFARPGSGESPVGFKLSTRDLNRADALAEKAGIGKLTAEESTELENYRSVGTALEFMKAKARLALKTKAI